MTLSRFAIVACLLAALSVGAQQDLRATLFAEADGALREARAANAELLAPATFARGAEAYAGAESDLARGRNMERIRSALDAAARAFTEARQAAEIANVTLAAVIKTRADATNANAATFAGDLWIEASESFDSAARRLEDGDIRSARSRADEAEALFRDAELTAIKAQYLSQTRALLAEAEQARVPRTAPRTYEKARSLLAEAERELSENRYDTDLPRSLAQQANYEARHAIYLAGLIERLRGEDQSLEDLILSYEQPLLDISAAADKAAQLDQGIEPVVTELVAYIEGLREQAAQSQRDLSDTRTRVGDLEEEIRDLDQRLGGVSQERVALVQPAVALCRADRQRRHPASAGRAGHRQRYAVGEGQRQLRATRPRGRRSTTRCRRRRRWRAASEQTDDPWIYLTQGQQTHVEVAGSAQNVNTIHFVQIDVNAATGGWSVGGVAYGNTDAFRSAVQANWDPGLRADQRRRQLQRPPHQLGGVERPRILCAGAGHSRVATSSSSARPTSTAATISACTARTCSTSRICAPTSSPTSTTTIW